MYAPATCPVCPVCLQVDTAALLQAISRELRSEQEPTRLEALRWVHFLLVRSQSQVCAGKAGHGSGHGNWALA